MGLVQKSEGKREFVRPRHKWDLSKCVLRKHKGSVWTGHVSDNTLVRSLLKAVRYRLPIRVIVSFLEQGKHQSVTRKTLSIGNP
jgi:hypothetical protein